MTPNLASKLQQAEQELRSLLAQIDSDKPLGTLAVGPETEQLTHFNRDYQARKIATAVIDPEELKALVRVDIVTQLNDLLALEDELQISPSEQADTIQFDRANARYDQKIGTADLVARRANLFLNTETEKGATPEESADIAAETWIPLQTLKGKSAGELTRVILRTIPVDAQLDADLTDLFLALLQGVATNPDVLPMLEKTTLDRSYTGLSQLAASQAFRDATGPALAPLLNLLIEQGGVEPHDPSFRAAYQAVEQFMKTQALSAPKAAPFAPATQPQTIVAQPIPTSAATQPPVPVSTTTPAAPTSVPIRTAPPVVAPAAPTVDFRHPDQTSETPPTPTPPGQQSKIKPINIQ